MGQDNTEFVEKYIAELEKVACNACGANDNEVVADHERFGLPLQTVICRNCGLIFLNPRPTKDMYTEFYKSDYRKAVSGSDEGSDRQFEREYDFALQVSIPAIKKILPHWSPKSMMELGSSYGGILYAHMCHFPESAAFGIEPLVKIGEYARQRTGATIYTTLFEDFSPDRQYDLIILSRTLNHTLDPKSNLAKVRSMLTEDGIFVLILQDPISHTIHMPFERVTEMTHPYMFTRESIQFMLQLTGLDVVGYQDEYIDARQMTRSDFRKLSFSYMVMLSSPGQLNQDNPQKPDYQDALARIKANQQAYSRYGSFIERWRHPTIPMRLYRKILHILGRW